MWHKDTVIFKRGNLSWVFQKGQGVSWSRFLLSFHNCWVQFSSVELLSLIQLFVIPWTTAHQASLVLHCLPEFAQIHVDWVGHAIQSSHPLLPSIFPSIRVISKESVLCIRWPKYWSFSFSISSTNEYSVLISFRVEWFDLFAIQGTLKSLLQHHSSKASIPTRMTTSKVGWNFVSHPLCLAHFLVHS